jgi:hypothetical protein
MKHKISSLLILTILLSACAPSQKIVSSWVNREVQPKVPYNKIFVVAITQNQKAKLITEDLMAKLLESRGRKVLKANEIFPMRQEDTPAISKDLLIGAIQRKECDAVMTIALLDVQTEERYVSGTSYAPVGMYGYYGSYYGYYGYRYPQVYTPGYYSTDKTYFVETNFYDMATDKLLWSIQSSSYNPVNLEEWFKGYAAITLEQLKKEGLIKK